ncbi:lymphocyte antigen 75-like [Polyodon spathula]|uniref:lymphocyte antigen 75-like n=1 Tax=Polyodon spathula TaxID=7913 RepID=UPI001B7DBDCA|nr:lymphocyte antigen 75-like [Polyodon spathula]
MDRRLYHFYTSLILGLTAFTLETAASGNLWHASFTIHHNFKDSCLEVAGSQLNLVQCKNSPSMQWKWGTRHRLYNIQSMQCLGLDLSKSAVGMFECDTVHVMLWWRCSQHFLFSASQYRLSATSGTVTASLNSNDTWTKDSSSDSICHQPYEEVYTTRGNSFGLPCEFPFKYNGMWHHDCTSDEREEGMEWCATTSLYDTEKKWGICLKPETGCKRLWNKDSETEYCYQFNFQSSLSWKEARVSCLSQGGDLLSVSNTTELLYILGKEGYPDYVWIGLNQLDLAGGWQWSDDSPLAFVNWKQGMPSLSILKESSCGVMQSEGRWESFSCESKLPYICKKKNNGLQPEIENSWKYKTTSCQLDWLPYNGYCYMMGKEPDTQAMAIKTCEEKRGVLISIHSLEDIELIITKLHNNTEIDVWTGLINNQSPALFEWTDGTPVTFTYWSRNEPSVPFNKTPNCVAYTGQLGNWKVVPCEEKLPFVCKMNGEVKNETKSDEGCPTDGDWKRYGDSCYKVDKNEVFFQESFNLSITNRFEQAFINSLIRKYSKDDTKYFWTSLQDKNNNGQYEWITKEGLHPVTFTNWNMYQPDVLGGCVAMSAGKSLGMWEVKDCKNFKAMAIYKKVIGNRRNPEPGINPNATCQDGWYSKKDLLYCYKAFHHERLSRKRTWEEAERFCESLGAHLPSFQNFDEVQSVHYVLRDTISDDRFFWIGLNKRYRNNWKWSDNAPVSSTMLLNEFHEDDYLVRDCVAFKTMKPNMRTLYRFMLPTQKMQYFYLKPFHCGAKLEWICQIPRGVKSKMPDWYNPGAHHQSSVFIDGDEFWFVNDSKLTYDEASLYCESNGSVLASPKSFTAARMIQDSIRTISKDSTQKWWLNNTYHLKSIPMRFWLQPFPPRECLFITADSMRVAAFWEVDCEQRLPFVCETINTTALETDSRTHHTVGELCDNATMSFGDKCYIIIQPKSVPFAKASELCISLGGTLPTISSQIEQDFITTLLPGMQPRLWIGLEMNLKTGNPEWVDKSPLTYVNFNTLLHGRTREVKIDHLNPESVKQCTFILNDPASSFVGTWDFTSCSDSNYVGICQAYRAKAQEPDVSNATLQFHGHTYKIIKQNLTWYDALVQCRAEKMELTSISETYQQAFLTVTINRFTQPAWIGLFSEDDGLHFRWSDNTHIVYSRWSEDDTEPSGECVYMGTDGYWKATACEEKLAGAICHIPKNDSTTQPDAESSKCPHKIQDVPWIPFRNNCYTFQTAAKRWHSFQPHEAHRVCKSLDPNAEILSIRDEHENEFIKQQLKPFSSLARWVWIGVYYDGNGSLKWYDGTYVQYSNWRRGRPELNSSDFYTGIQSDGAWDLLPYDPFFKYFQDHSIVACKIERDFKDDYQQSLSGFIKRGNFSFRLIQKKMNWYDVLRECKSSESDLASIRDEAQQLFLKHLVKLDGFPLWIGLSNQDDTGSSFEWSDGAVFDYKPWEFENSNSTGNCVFIDTKGFWKRANCNTVLDGAVCYNKTTPRSNIADTTVSSRCPKSNGLSNWVHYKDHCYAFDTSFYNYSVFTMEEAKAFCQTLDPSSHLLTIQDADENEFVISQVKKHPLITGRVWLGITLDSQDHPEGWIDGSSISFSNWEKNTDKEKSKGSCSVLVSASGTWTYVSCNHSRSRLVCKAPNRLENTAVIIAFILLMVITGIAGIVYLLYRRNRMRFSSMFSSVRYERGFDDADSTSILTETRDE